MICTIKFVGVYVLMRLCVYVRMYEWALEYMYACVSPCNCIPMLCVVFVRCLLFFHVKILLPSLFAHLFLRHTDQMKEAHFQ